ncbi:MAG: hypothetical protein ACXVI6_00015 [Candidatus Aminicenantales bacterium]
MSWGAYAILVIFGAFVLLLILNPNMSCFGKRVKSPFYPLKRKRALKKKMTDYKFNLVEGPDRKPETASRGGQDKKAAENKAPGKKTDDYGFRLD